MSTLSLVVFVIWSIIGLIYGLNGEDTNMLLCFMLSFLAGRFGSVRDG